MLIIAVWICFIDHGRHVVSHVQHAGVYRLVVVVDMNNVQIVPITSWSKILEAEIDARVIAGDVDARSSNAWLDGLTVVAVDVGQGRRQAGVGEHEAQADSNGMWGSAVVEGGDVEVLGGGEGCEKVEKNGQCTLGRHGQCGRFLDDVDAC